MKRLINICLLVLASYASASGQDEMYHGGFGRGDIYEGLIAYNFQQPYMYTAYYGGSGDGYAYDDTVAYTFPAPPMYYVFHGGSGDGYGHDDTIAYTFPDPFMYYVFFGGSGDGYAGDENAPYNFPHPPMYYAYFGGQGDGYAGDTFNFFIVLPVHLLSFEGRVMGDDGLLKWVVAGEKDISAYELERSTDGKNYRAIHSQPATAFTTGEKNYSYLDETPAPGANYYRLRILNKDGSADYSQVVMLLFGRNEESLTISPNPASSILMVRYSSNVKATVKIVDMRGVTMKMQEMNNSTGTMTLAVDDLPPGYYLLQFSSETGMNKTLKFVKQ